VCVIGYQLWRKLYGESPDVVDHAIRVNGNQFQIVGVVSGSFFGLNVDDKPEIFMPLEAERTYRDYKIMYGKQTPSLDDPHATLVSIVGRLKPGASVSQANAGLQVLSPEILRALSPISDGSAGQLAIRASLVAHPIQNGTSTVWLQDMDVVLLLMTMAAVSLIIACANLGNLLLARAAKRRSEIATRLALGATRWRLVRQLLTESLALSVIGAATGLIIARWGSGILLWALSFPGEPIQLDLSWDAKLAAFAVSVTLSCAVLFGLAPAIRATDISLYSVINSGMRTGRHINKFMNTVLVVVQVALSVALLISAGLLTRTLQALLAQDPGYNPKGVIVAHTNWRGVRENPQREALVGKELLAAFRSQPGVMSASWTRVFSKTTLAQLVFPRPSGLDSRSGSHLIFVSSDYFGTRRTPILAGRDFNPSDTDASLPVAILSEALAKALFGGVSPVGLRFRENDGDGNGHDYFVEIVGIVRDIQYRRPSDGALPILYRPVAQCARSCSGLGNYEIRGIGRFAETAKGLETAAATVDPHIVLKCDPLSDAVGNSVHRNRAMTAIATTFGMFVALLAMIGVYGVTSHAAEERTREIGVRMALGAEPRDVLRMLFGEMIRVVCIGIAIGLASVVPATTMIRGAIWGVRPNDPLTIALAVCLMLLIVGIAAFVPARRATRVDPMIALRFE
jgi:predicted permease